MSDVHGKARGLGHTAEPTGPVSPDKGSAKIGANGADEAALVGWPPSFPLFLGVRRERPDLDRLRWPEPPPWRAFTPQSREARGRDFVPSAEAMEMVNAALLLHRPLLVTGKPGVGKTSLAHAVAFELGLGEVLEWAITSRTTLQQGLYHYDAIGRLQEAALLKTKIDGTKIEGADVVPDIGDFLQLGPLGTAFLETSNGRPRVLLIDEFDKSDIDLPNDLLNVLEEGRFSIPELKRTKQTRVKVTDWQGAEAVIEEGILRCHQFPFILITSNGEREFPPAFLRRCLRLEMPQPNEAQLTDILRARLFPALSSTASGSVGEAGTEQRNEITSAIFELARDFVARRDHGTETHGPQELATDQLISAAYFVLQGGDLEKRPALKEALLRALKGEF